MINDRHGNLRRTMYLDNTVKITNNYNFYLNSRTSTIERNVKGFFSDIHILILEV